MKRILVAIDGSDGAGRAVDYAAHLAKDNGAELSIVHVISDYGLPDDLFRRLIDLRQAWLKEQLESASAEILNTARNRARAIGVSVIRLDSRAGDVAETILEVAQEQDVDIIVIGKRGLGRVARLLLGSISQKIASLALRPVIIIP
jgi:nucleotide-binding universal stress UspA family protein